MNASDAPARAGGRFVRSPCLMREVLAYYGSLPDFSFAKVQKLVVARELLQARPA